MGDIGGVLPSEDFELNIYCIVVWSQWSGLSAPSCAFEVCIPVDHYLQGIP